MLYTLTHGSEEVPTEPRGYGRIPGRSGGVCMDKGIEYIELLRYPVDTLYFL